MNRHKCKNLFWGIILLLIAVGIVAYQMGYLGIMVLPTISLWQVIFGIVILYALIESIAHLSFGGIFFSLAFACIVFKEQLHVEKIVPWTVLFAALLATIAFDMIFGGRGNWKNNRSKLFDNGGMKHHGFRGKSNVQPETVNADIVHESVSFCGATKFIHSDNFQEADLSCSFCGAEFYFDKVNVPSGQATITISNRYAGVQIYIPRNWTIINRINSFCGSVEIDRRVEGEAGPSLILQGDNRFGGIEIIRV